ncbi:hypothetical protein EYF80_061748 [Liparis tanakae]|uniref:Uncharacterized protein n=1 Tax=Liparis tanakae TaxID=230148 RepID=A0A4Z2EH41_9TELE|nr:hypothetical protein EYF80_061748 [Liparis tanakae]
MKLGEAPSPAEVDVAYLAAEYALVAQSLVGAVPAAAGALRHALQAVSVLDGRVGVPLARRPLHAPRPLVVSDQLLRQAHPEVALGELLAVEARRRRAPPALPQDDVGVDDAQVDVEPQEVAPPLLARPAHLVALPQLVAQVDALHVLLVQKQGQRSRHAEGHAPRRGGGGAVHAAVALALLPVRVRRLPTRTDAHDPRGGVGGEAGDHLDVPCHGGHQVAALTLVELALRQLAHVAGAQHLGVALAPRLGRPAGVQPVPQQPLEERHRGEEAVHEEVVVLALQAAHQGGHDPVAQGGRHLVLAGLADPERESHSIHTVRPLLRGLEGMYWVGEKRPFMTMADLSMVRQRLGVYASHMVFSTTSRRCLILKRASYPRSPRTGSVSRSHSWRYWKSAEVQSESESSSKLKKLLCSSSSKSEKSISESFEAVSEQLVEVE